MKLQQPSLSTVPDISLGETKEISAPVHPLLIAYLLQNQNQKGPHLLVSSQKDLLLKVQSALRFFEPEQKIFIYEEKKLEPSGTLTLSRQAEARRLKVLSRAQKATSADVFMAQPQSLLERLPSPHTLKARYIPLQKGHNLPPNFAEQLKQVGYEYRDRVEQIGEFSMRGAVVDIFCPFNGPLRLDLIGHEVDQVRLFNVQTQVSVQEINLKEIAPVKEDFNKNSTPSPFGFLDYLPSPLVWLLEEPALLQSNLHEWKTNLSQMAISAGEKVSVDLISDSSPMLSAKGLTFEQRYLPDWRTQKTKELVFTLNEERGQVGLNGPYLSSPVSNLCYKREKPPKLNPAQNLLGLKMFFKNPAWPRQIKEQRDKGMLVFIFAGKEKVRLGLKSALEKEGVWVREEKDFFEMSLEQEHNPSLVHFIQSLSLESLIWPEKNLMFLKADSFVGFSRSKQKPFFPEKSQAGHFSFADIQKGDLMVHRQYGIGRFQQLKLLNFGTGKSEFLILEYKDKEKLYVPVSAVHQVQKYMTFVKSDGEKLLDKLGGSRWLNTKKRVKDKIKNMSLELMNLYHLRAGLKRKRFSPPDLDFEKFEEEFPFVETPDQKKAIQDIIKDLTGKDPPADRLICGDTGFGKTEVAMRAVFKVIEDGYQVALMSPTTLLSFQHFETFKDRFKNWPVSIRLLNRFTSLKERKTLLKEVRDGRTDILIGTHRILSRDIRFKRPGLLIIDEEHLFGVKSKEKIKNWHTHIDTLSLSATPIPRSFSMSLSGLRDISLILTPPLNRKAVHTVISPFSEGVIKKAVLKERERKGQIIFIHNRIATLDKVERRLKTLLPFVRIRVAHGKMKNLQEKIVLDFFQQKFELLLCTTIVESGMDFTNAGTLFIDRAEQFGLSELHQLRGRVGRSEKPAYCYMLVEERKNLSEKAKERLRIVQENNQPGAGITIAQYDLEMRGAGELMGREQSGFLQEVGYELYFEFLRESLSAINKTGSGQAEPAPRVLPFEKGQGATFEDSPTSMVGKKPESHAFSSDWGSNTVSIAPEPDLQLNYPAFIPEAYIPHEKTRLIFYKKLATSRLEEEVESIKKELEDFAGPLPEEVENLILLSHCRWLSKQYHIRELAHRPPFLYMSLAESTPVPVSQIVQWVERGVCEWQDKETLKFSLPEESISAVFFLLKTLQNHHHN